MSQQYTAQASGQGMLKRVFKLHEHGMMVRTEVITSFTTSLTVIYIVFVSPQTLGVTDVGTSTVFVMTYLVAALGSIIMEPFTDLPVALVPTIGLNMFFSLIAVQVMGLPWQVGVGAVFWGTTGLLLLTALYVRYQMIANVPVGLHVGITSGIGLFISMMGLEDVGVIVANLETLVGTGNLTSHNVLLGILGFSIIAILALRSIYTVMLVSIVVTTLLGQVLGDVHYNDIVSMPPSVMSVVGRVGLAESSNLGLAGMISFFMLINLFDSSGTLINVTDRADLADEEGKFPRIRQVLYVDSISSVTDPFIGTSSVTAYIESSLGVSVGGRAGLTVVVIGSLLLLVIFLSPLTRMVPDYIAAGALIYTGMLMTSSLARVSWQDLAGSIPAFITVVVIPFSLSITEGVALGFISYCMMKIGTGHLCDLSPCVITITLLFILKVIFIDAH